jgi:hypothetical protein
MALAMARPWKHPRTGMYWLRRAVPADLRPLVGKREEKRTLGTRDPEEAKRKHVEALAELESRWAALRAGGLAPASVAGTPRSLTEVEAQELAAWMFDHWIRRHRDNPSEQRFWRADLYDRLWRPPTFSGTSLIQAGAVQAASADDYKLKELEQWCLDEADTLAFVKELVLDETSRLKLARAIAGAVQRASQRLALMAQGHYEGLQSFPSSGTIVPHRPKSALPSAPVLSRSRRCSTGGQQRSGPQLKRSTSGNV